MIRQIRPALVLLSLFTVLLGLVYPLFVTAAAQIVVPEKANGSLIRIHGEIRGSHLIGQPFDDPKYFWSRPSATQDSDSKPLPYNGQASLGSNLGPTNPALTDAVKARIEALRAADPIATGALPVDLVTASASGLDPHLSLASVLYQVGRVSAVRHLDEARVRELVKAHTTEPLLGVLGETVVNVVELNLALDELR